MIPSQDTKNLEWSPCGPLWKMFQTLSIFPRFTKGWAPDRSFMWNILSTLKPDECKQLINEARVVRSKKDEENNNELIEIHPDFFEKA